MITANKQTEVFTKKSIKKGRGLGAGISFADSEDLRFPSSSDTPSVPFTPINLY